MLPSLHSSSNGPLNGFSKPNEPLKVMKDARVNNLDGFLHKFDNNLKTSK